MPKGLREEINEKWELLNSLKNENGIVEEPESLMIGTANDLINSLNVELQYAKKNVREEEEWIDYLEKETIKLIKELNLLSFNQIVLLRINPMTSFLLIESDEMLLQEIDNKAEEFKEENEMDF